MAPSLPCRQCIRKIPRFQPEVESRTQSSRPRTQKNPRPRTAFPRTDPLEAKNTAASVLQKIEIKGHQKSFSGNLQFIGVARIFDWGDLNHKSHAMTLSKTCLLALHQDFAKREGLN